MTFVLINNQPDGRHVRAFKTDTAALKALAKFVGRPVGEFRVGQTVYDDWGGRLIVEERPTGHTATLEAKFARAYDAREMGTATKAQLALLDRAEEIAEFGDGRPTFHHGQDGDPRNGERIFNTKEDDAANDAAAEALRAEERRWRQDP